MAGYSSEPEDGFLIYSVIHKRGSFNNRDIARGAERHGQGETVEDKTLNTTLIVDERLNVKARLEQLSAWHEEWKREDQLLAARVAQLDPSKHKIDKQRSVQIASLRRRLRMRLVKQALEISAEVVQRVGYEKLRKNLAEQFITLSDKERLLWLNNFLFIMTPDLAALNNKIARIREYRSLGQQRNFLLGGHSGMGKTTYLDWFTSNRLPRVEATRNYVPVIKIDAPVNNNTPRPLFQRMLLECGVTYHERDYEEDLLMLIVHYFQQCGVEIVIVDEVQQIKRVDIRRRLLEVSNMTPGITYICASCEPLRWSEGDIEVEGRWNDYVELPQYTGKRLQQLLSFIQLLLPFTQSSSLSTYDIEPAKKSGDKKVDGPAKLIERWTGGVLRDIMILIADASRRAITQQSPCLTPEILAEAWQSIQTRQVTDFLKVLPEGK